VGICWLVAMKRDRADDGLSTVRPLGNDLANDRWSVAHVLLLLDGAVDDKRRTEGCCVLLDGVCKSENVGKKETGLLASGFDHVARDLRDYIVVGSLHVQILHVGAHELRVIVLDL